LSGTSKQVPNKTGVLSEPARQLLFSIIIATYNRAHLFPRAINSVLSQTYQNFEIIVVDDGSSDNTEEVVNSFRVDKRIIYDKNEENLGLSATWNKGLDLASGDYVVFLDDDDELLPDALEAAAAKIAELSPEGVRTIWFDSMDFETGKITGRGINKDGYVTYEDHLCGKVGGDFWTVIDRSLFGGNRFDERAWGGSAGLLWLKVFYQAKVFHVAKPFGITHREHGSTVSRDFRIRIRHREKNLWAAKIFLQEHGEELKRLCPRVYGSRLVDLGLFSLLNSEKAEGVKALFKSLRFYFSFRAVMLILLSPFFNERQIASLSIKSADIKNSLKNFIASFRSKTHPGAEPDA